jgi:hypothetical protein
MFKYLVGISLVGVAFFGGLHLWMRLDGSPGPEIQGVLLAFLIFGGVCGTFSAMRHGAGFGIWCLIMVSFSVWCGISILTVDRPILGLTAGSVLLLVLLWLAYQEYLDTPYSRYNRVARAVPGLGVVIMSGRTPRAVALELKKMKSAQKT